VYEQPSPGHRVGPALVALLVALAATAGTFGYLVTRRVVQAEGLGGTSATTSPATPGTQGSGTTPTRPATTGTPAPNDPAAACPAVTVKAVRDAGLNADLTVLLYIRTHREGVTDIQVWICKNADDLLIYQGHVMRGQLRAAESNSSLLLAEGVKGTVVREGTGYKATNVVGDRSTEYHVSRELLVIRNLPQDTGEEHPVVEAKP
jgi:hypothetical protein